MNERKAYQGKHILAKDIYKETDTWKSGLNNNVLVFGPSGSGKTRHYVIPNILISHESMIISDTKGDLYGLTAGKLEEKGFTTYRIDLTDLENSYGFNPLDNIRYDNGHWNEQDIMSLCQCLIKEDQTDEPYWGNAARQYLACLISYILEMYPEENRTLKEVMNLLSRMDSDTFSALITEASYLYPNSTVLLRYNAFKGIARAEKMDASIRGIVSTNLDPLCFSQACALYRQKKRIEISEAGKRKTAIFLTVSDTDRSMDKLADIFMSQAIQILCRSADHDYKEHRLAVPVRFYLDDFATNLFIPDFDKIISVIRSREISTSVILQSLSQLNALYGNDKAATIVNNCDTQIYLGGQDRDTVAYIAERANRTTDSIMSLPLNKIYLFIRGQKPILCEKYESAEATGDPETGFQKKEEYEYAFC